MEIMSLKTYLNLISAICLTLHGVQGAVKEGLLPMDIEECLKMAETCKNSIKITDEAIYNMCEELFNENRNGGYKIKAEHLAHFKEILENIQSGGRKHRHKRDAHCPKRVRKEVRKHSPEEWQRFTDAVNALKEKGLYDSLAAIHRGFTRLSTAHGGPNFLGWHRVYLLVFEDLLREEEPCVTLPYWDSSLDYYMADPTESVLWTPRFFGNGNGEVVTGPFGGWITGINQPLSRNIGSGGSLITKRDIRRVLRYYNNWNSDITDLFNRPDDAIELYHNSPHVWVDGHMSGLNTAAEDPVFYMHHAFIDCWWQKFRNKIWRHWNVNSTFDYPDIGGLHNGSNFMDPWNDTRNSDGYSDNLLNYKCQNFPVCTTRWRRACRSEYLICQDFDERPRARCVSVAGAQARVAAREFVGLQISAEGMIPPPLQPTRSRPLMDPGPTFQAFVVDKRTLGDPLQRKIADFPTARPKRAVSVGNSSKSTSSFNLTPCSVLKDIATLHYSIAYLNPAQIQETDEKTNEFVYIPIILIPKSNSDVENRFTALVYGTEYNTRYRVNLQMFSVQNTAFAIVPIVNPQLVTLEYVITVVGVDGKMCRSECLEDAISQTFVHCSGAITVNTDDPDMYRTRYQDLVDDLNKKNDHIQGIGSWVGKNIFLKFNCG